ncbi:MAG: iron-sulfur cluster insertion protein ErpA [Chloroflexota bacterium]|nr:iron-sulfur cluster insertion protein ErpA [Chloroflexota bacterium]
MSVITEEQTAIVLTDEAAAQVRTLVEKQGRDDLALRLFVTQGGCSGFSYGMALDPNTRADDAVFEKDGVRLIVDAFSQKYLSGVEVGFSSNLMGGGFTIKNPNAASSCGCGHSFRTKEEDGQPKRCGH